MKTWLCFCAAAALAFGQSTYKAPRTSEGKPDLSGIWFTQAFAAAWRGSGAWQGLVRMLRIGLPIGLHLSFELSMFVAVALLMGRFGTAAIAGHQVAIMLCALSFMVPVGIAGVINGSTLTYLAGCDQATGKLKHLPSFFIQKGLDLLKMIGTEPIIDLYLDQWTHGKTSIDNTLFKKINDSNFVNGDDNLAFDLSLQGCCKANKNFDTQNYTQNCTYYLSIVTSKTDPLLGRQRPAFLMNPLLQPFALYQGVDDPFGSSLIKPIPGWGAGDLTLDKWRENDGAVSSISQRFPFTAGDHPVGGEGIFGRPAGAIQKGKWYYQRAENIVQHRFDHFDVVLGSKINMLDRSVEAAQRNLYRELCTFLRDL